MQPLTIYCNMNLLVLTENYWLFNFRLNYLTEASFLVLLNFSTDFLWVSMEHNHFEADNDSFASTFPTVKPITSGFYFIEFIKFYQSKAES